MAALVIAEHDNASLKPATLNTISAAVKTGGDVTVLVAGAGCEAVAQAAAQVQGVSKVLLADAKVGPGDATDDLVRPTGGLDDMPLIVLTQGDVSSPSAASPDVWRGWVDLQRRFAGRSRRGRQVVVPESGHGMPIEAPDAIIAAVREMVTTVRSAPAEAR